MKYPRTEISECACIGEWTSKGIPVYSVYSMNGLNQLVGYVKYINSTNGTILYRGQCELYERLLPSILRPDEERTLEEKDRRLHDSVQGVTSDEDLRKFFCFPKNEMVTGWKIYENTAVEAVLQHYGAKTYCVDFVDNHWTALWFGLYRWNSEENKYEKRCERKDTDEDKYINFFNYKEFSISSMPITYDESDIDPCRKKFFAELASKYERSYAELISREIWKMNREENDRWEAKNKRILQEKKKFEKQIKQFELDNEYGHMYMLLYLAETDYPTIGGMTVGRKTYTIDLRKALPSTFLRPSAQHGWIVKGRDKSYAFEEDIVCVIRINVKLVNELLGNGLLASQKNFFPSIDCDWGYRVLLQRQMDTNISKVDRLKDVLPKDMIKAME